MTESWPEFAEKFYSGAGGEVDGCMLMLRFFGDELDPEEVTELIGTQPTKAHRKGDPRDTKPSIHEQTGLWLLQRQRTGETADNEVMLLLDSLTPELSAWKSLANRFSAGIKVHLYLDRWCRETILSPETIVSLAERRLKLNIDIYSATPSSHPLIG